jgi:pteridine reductase
MSTARPMQRAALVTGSGKKRLGWHIVHALAERGFNVAVHCRTSVKEAAETVHGLRSLGIEAEAYQANLAEETEVRALVQSVLNRFGRMDVLVNCAAVYHPQRLEDVTAADVRSHFDANLLATFLCTQHAGLAMVHQPEGGCIVNFGDWALARPYRDYAAYFATKGAIPVLTRCMAVELGSRNPRVRVNGILPGPVLFPHDMPDAERQEAVRSTLAQREGGPESMTTTVLFFVENEFVTGVCLPVDGGRTIFPGRG